MYVSEENQIKYRLLQSHKYTVECLNASLRQAREVLYKKLAVLKAISAKEAERKQIADNRRKEIKEAQTEAGIVARSKEVVETAKQIALTKDVPAILTASIDVEDDILRK